MEPRADCPFCIPVQRHSHARRWYLFPCHLKLSYSAFAVLPLHLQPAGTRSLCLLSAHPFLAPGQSLCAKISPAPYSCAALWPQGMLSPVVARHLDSHAAYTDKWVAASSTPQSLPLGMFERSLVLTEHCALKLYPYQIETMAYYPGI